MPTRSQSTWIGVKLEEAISQFNHRYLEGRSSAAPALNMLGGSELDMVLTGMMNRMGASASRTIEEIPTITTTTSAGLNYVALCDIEEGECNKLTATLKVATTKLRRATGTGSTQSTIFPTCPGADEKEEPTRVRSATGTGCAQSMFLPLALVPMSGKCRQQEKSAIYGRSPMSGKRKQQKHPAISGSNNCDIYKQFQQDKTGH